MSWSDQSNNNNDKMTSWKDQQNSKKENERKMIYNTFLTLAKTRVVEETQRTESGLLNESPAYKEEAKQLNSLLTTGVAQGLAGGLFVFASLRASHRLMPHLVNQLRGHGSHSKPITAKPVKSSYQFDSTASEGTIRKPPLFLRGLRMGLDITLSLFLGSAISEYFTDTDQMVQTAANIPLVAGRSAISDVLCKDFVQLYTSIPKQTWETHKGSSTEWDALGTFCQNCIRRQTLEKEVLAQQAPFNKDLFGEEEGGERGERHVEIPMPGVPKDFPIDIRWGDGSDAVSVGKELRDDDFIEPTFDFVDDDDGQFTTDFDNFDGDKDEKRKRP